MAELLNTEVENGETDEVDLIANMAQLILAGLKTTSLLIDSAIHTFLLHPGQLADFMQHPVLDRRLVGGAIRYVNPVQMVGRVCQKDFEFYGKKLRAGDDVISVLGSANRDPAIFDDTGRFDIHRKSSGQAGAGFGELFCLGATLARTEARVALRVLFKRLPRMRQLSETLEITDRVAFTVPSCLRLGIER